MSNDNKIKDKIAKLLRLARGKANVHESAAAFAHAQRLAAREGIDLDSIDTSPDWKPPTVQEIEQRTIESGKRIAYWRQVLLIHVCEAHGVGLYRAIGNDLKIYGQPRDMDAVECFYAVGCEEIDRLAATQAGHGRSWIASFRAGAAQEIGTAIKTSARTALDVGAPDVVHGTEAESTALARRDALACYARDTEAAIAQWKREQGLRTRAGSRRSVRTDAYTAGRAAGQTVRMGGHKAIGGSS